MKKSVSPVSPVSTVSFQLFRLRSMKARVDGRPYTVGGENCSPHSSSLRSASKPNRVKPFSICKMYQNRTKQTQRNYRSYFQAVKLILALFLEKNECGARTYDQGLKVCQLESTTSIFVPPRTTGIGETGKASAPCGGSVRGISGLLIDSGGNCQRNKPNLLKQFIIIKMTGNGPKQTQSNYRSCFQSVEPVYEQI